MPWSVIHQLLSKQYIFFVYYDGALRILLPKATVAKIYYFIIFIDIFISLVLVTRLIIKKWHVSLKTIKFERYYIVLVTNE